MRSCDITKCSIGLALSLGLQMQANASKTTMCVFDLLGTSGDTFAMMKDYALNSKALGVDLTLLPYTDETVAINDYRQKKCDMVTATGVSLREFNRFVGTMNSQGAIPTQQVANIAMRLVANPKLKKEMTSGSHEVTGIIPMGSVYMLTSGNWFKDTSDLHGHSVGYLETDPMQKHAWSRLGLKPIPLKVAQYNQKFNQGQLDVLPSPIMAIKPLELEIGLNRNDGKIVRYPLVYLSWMVVMDHSKFPKDFGIYSRDWFNRQLPRSFRMIKALEDNVPKKYWIEVSPSDQERYNMLMRQVGQRYVKDGVYDPKMLTILKRIRCQFNPTETECKP
jgi:hypothetical protein